MVKKADIPKHLIDTAFALAAERPWHEISLAAIAEAAKLPLSKVIPVYPSKPALLSAFSRSIDLEVLADDSMAEDWAAADESEDGSSARDRLFDVLMRRFDALQPYKAGLGNIVYDQIKDPLAAGCSAFVLRRSMAAMLEAARIPADGLKGALKIKALMLIYLASLRVWLRDESVDMARTMAALDGYLRRIEAFKRNCPSRRKPH